ncbi:hypothetical protein LNP74_05145 [Klebsiella pneumoniae subsp. pneumoniae]|nr:hypothetical protein [Klebsiella pneumoniae subsp. pneumoniae]
MAGCPAALRRGDRMIANPPGDGAEVNTSNVYAGSDRAFLPPLLPPQRGLHSACTRITIAAPGAASAELGVMAGADRVGRPPVWQRRTVPANSLW